MADIELSHTLGRLQNCSAMKHPSRLRPLSGEKQNLSVSD